MKINDITVKLWGVVRNYISVADAVDTVVLTPAEARAVAAELVRLADEIEKGKRHENP